MSTMPEDLRTWDEFRANDVIDALRPLPRWTVSGRLGDDPQATAKAPIDMCELLDTGHVRGARTHDETCLVTLDELADRLPNAANAAFYLTSAIDGCLVVDIEPGCPPEVSANLLAMPGILYAEVSMSGRGYHLVMPRPDNLSEHPTAARKAVLRETHGWYELLCTHWVTFTRRPIPEGNLDRARAVDLDAAPFSSIEDVFADLADHTPADRNGAATDISTRDRRPVIRGDAEIIRRTVEDATPRLKTLGDFDNDTSRWEFSVLGTLHHAMRRPLIRVGFMERQSYDGEAQAWLLYEAALQVLPHREKHDTKRHGRPYLLYEAAAMVAAHRDATN